MPKCYSLSYILKSYRLKAIYELIWFGQHALTKVLTTNGSVNWLQTRWALSNFGLEINQIRDHNRITYIGAVRTASRNSDQMLSKLKKISCETLKYVVIRIEI